MEAAAYHAGGGPAPSRSHLGATTRASTAAPAQQLSDAELAAAAAAAAGQQQAAASSSSADNIKVVVRLRPLFPNEVSKGAANVMHTSEDCSSLKVTCCAA